MISEYEFFSYFIELFFLMYKGFASTFLNNPYRYKWLQIRYLLIIHKQLNYIIYKYSIKYFLILSK